MDQRKDREQQWERQREKAEGGGTTEPGAGRERDGARQRARDEGEADELRSGDSSRRESMASQEARRSSDNSHSTSFRSNFWKPDMRFGQISPLHLSVSVESIKNPLFELHSPLHYNQVKRNSQAGLRLLACPTEPIKPY